MTWNIKIWQAAAAGSIALLLVTGSSTRLGAPDVSPVEQSPNAGMDSAGTSYLWDFGDGSTAAKRIVNHQYLRAGSYEWIVTATKNGSPCSKSGSITIGAVSPDFKGAIELDGDPLQNGIVKPLLGTSGSETMEETGQSRPSDETAIGCTTTVPATGTLNTNVQFAVTVSFLKPGALIEADSIVGNLRYVPPTGSKGFFQGSPLSESCRQSNEARFTHILSRDLAVMETEVTRRMWSNLRAAQPTLPADPSYRGWGAEMTRPVQQVTCQESVLFANLLSLQQGLTRCYYTNSTRAVPISPSNYKKTANPYCDFSASGYRLPTEGEWEWFCRAKSKTPFSVPEPQYGSGNCACGNLPAFDGVAWYCATSRNHTHPAGEKIANPWNLKDVHGNVYEWCWDWAESYPSGTVTDYAGPGSGSYRAARGGSWHEDSRYCRSAARYSGAPGERWSGYGFRLCRSIL